MVQPQLVINQTDTIAAIATPPGTGGVAIIRISGPLIPEISTQLFRKPLSPRAAVYTPFFDVDGSVLDSGIFLYFPAPASYTGEDVLELHCHGGMVITDMLLTRILTFGIRLANPGEFTERAFLNNKIDLVQAEAVADLITGSTQQAVRSAQNSLQGLFSEQINALIEELIELRTYIEAAIDFVDEEIDFLTDGIVEQKIKQLLHKIQSITKTAQQGRLLRDGITVVLAGKPNTGKSSLLNALAGHEAAIVTHIAGTTRDVLRERIQLDGMPVNIIDTAGLRESQDIVEQEGIRRAHLEINKADVVLHMKDLSSSSDIDLEPFPDDIKVIEIYNKIDLVDREPSIQQTEFKTECYISVKTGAGLDLLKNHLKQLVGFQSEDNVFIARRRHLDALQKADRQIQCALEQLSVNQAFELVAEDLRLAQQQLGEITGQFSSDELLGRIFSSFCIGK